MAVTSNTYTVGGSGQAGPYSYSFPILADADIKVSVNGIVKSVTTHYTLDSSNTRITFVSGQEPSTGDKVIVYRDTDEDPINATFVSGSTIRSKELNDNFSQLLYIVQENDNQALSTLGGVMQGNLGLGLKNNLYFEGDTDDAYETTVTVVDPTADRTITLPNETGTVVTTGSSGVVTSTMITDGTIVNADVNASAAIAQSKLNIANATTSAAGYQSAADKTKLDGIESGATADQTNAEIRAAVEAASDSNVFTDADHTKLNAIEAGATADQTNAEIRAAVEAATDSNVFTDADHTKLNAIEASATADQTSTEIKALLASDNLDASHLAANSVGTSEIADAELVTLAGMPGATASILADSTALTSTTAELNLLDGKSIVTSISGTSTDVQLPTAKAVDDRVTALVTDVGGFRPIANETSFPATNPDPDDDTGTIVSVKALASNLTSNSSGVATIANGAGTGNTVTINGMANSDTIEAGKGILVETTSTLHTYTFHRETLAPADITAAKSAVDNFNERYRVNAGEPSSSLHEGDLVYDTNADKMKVYDTTTSAWKEVTSTGDFKYLFLCPAGGTGAPTLTNTTFDLREGSNSGAAASVTNAAQLIVSVNGVVQKANTGTSAPAEGFAMVDANTIIFGSNLPNNASVFIHQAGSAVSIPVPGDNTVSTVKIQNLAVSTGKIADQAVDLTKLPHGDGTSNGKYLRSNNGADPTWETISQYSTPLTTRGDLLYRDASGDQRLAKGTAGQYLKIGANDPEWADVVGAVADGCIFENDQTISNNYTIASGKGAHSVGPITVNATVTVNGNWVVS